MVIENTFKNEIKNMVLIKECISWWKSIFSSPLFILEYFLGTCDFFPQNKKDWEKFTRSIYLGQMTIKITSKRWNYYLERIYQRANQQTPQTNNNNIMHSSSHVTNRTMYSTTNWWSQMTVDVFKFSHRQITIVPRSLNRTHLNTQCRVSGCLSVIVSSVL